MATIDEVLAASRAGSAVPADERVWVLVEIAGDRRNWTTHNLPPDEAFKVLLLSALDLYMRMASRTEK